MVNSQLSPGRVRSRRLTVALIRPSKYDDEGYVIRHFRGVLPSNTLACLCSLTEDLNRRKSLGANLEIAARVFDDTVQPIPVEKIIRSHKPPHNRTVVALVAVQSNQFPRAADLARRFRAGGLQVLIGGFHVSGVLALFSEMRPEIAELVDTGVTVVKGEVEETWGDILGDALQDRLKPIYDFLDRRPDLCDKPVPTVCRAYLRRFIVSHFGTIDCGRGCPYSCNFCTVVNVQGRRVRYRSVQAIAAAIRENYRLHGIDYYFFTDDNFARNPAWRELCAMLERLRSEEGVSIQFMIQVDTQSHRIPGFVQLVARAGCTQVFIGVESISPQNLAAAGKAQNRVEDYRGMIATWHRERVATHVAYIIGFPFDTPESVAADVTHLKRELGVEQVSFFMLTPLPGSQDHLRMMRAGEYMDPDLNNYDSTHETMLHPNFSPGMWYAAYRRAWRDFYSFENMRDILANADAANYWNIFQKFIWYKYSVEIDGGHPMIHGFFRLKDRRDRRPGSLMEPRLRHWARRIREIGALVRLCFALLLEMEELWLQTRKRSQAEQHLMVELRRLREQAHRKLRIAEMRLAYDRARVHVPGLGVPSGLSLVFRDFNLALVKRLTYSRAEMQAFWETARAAWHRRQIFLIRPEEVLVNLLRDAQLLWLFACAFTRNELGPDTHSSCPR